MQIAKILGTKVLAVGEHTTLFPNTSFTSSGPTEEFLVENSCVPARTWLEYDSKTEKIIPTDPYLQGNIVLSVKAVKKTQEEIAQEAVDASLANKFARAMAYRDESDSLFFKAQRGEATMDEWLAKVEEIKARYP